MKCGSSCYFYSCYINNNQELIIYCKRQGKDIKDIPKNSRNNCKKFIDVNYRRHDILNDKF